MRRLLAVVVLAAASTAAAAAAGLFTPSRPSTSPVAISALLEDCRYGDAWDPECVRDKAAGLLAAGGDAGALVEGLVTATTGDDRIGECHQLLHAVGRSSPAVLLGSNLAASAWSACGFGLLHGTVEYAPLSGDDTANAKTLAAMCATFHAEQFGACLHSAGHTLTNAHPGEYNRALSVCKAAFARRADSYRCEVGVVMAISDAVLLRVYRGDVDVPSDEDGFEEIAAPCFELASEAVGACLRGFAQIGGVAASRERDTSSLDYNETRSEAEADATTALYLRWCENRHKEAAAHCAHAGGEIAAQRHANNVDVALTLCEQRRDCVAGAGDALAGFFGNDDALARVCTALRRLARPDAEQLCTMLRERFDQRADNRAADNPDADNPDADNLDATPSSP